MKKTILAVAMLLMATTAFVACDKEQADTTKPTIEVINPADGSTLYIGDTENCLYVKFADNIELESWAVEVHNNFNEHEHAHKSEDHHHDYTDEEIANAYKLPKTTDTFDKGLRNASIDIDDLIVIPEGSTPGEYHLGVYCIDAAGNQSEAWSHITITNKE